MFRALGLPLISLAMFSIAWGPLALLQGVAWVGMIWDYSRDVSLLEAVDRTLSGRYPCTMCEKVAEARKQEQQLPATLKVEKMGEGFFIASQHLLPLPFSRDFEHPPVGDDLLADGYADALKPPPRTI